MLTDPLYLTEHLPFFLRLLFRLLLLSLLRSAMMFLRYSDRLMNVIIWPSV